MMNFEKEKEELKLRIDEETRKLYANERKLNKFQINEKLLFITNNLWDSFQSIINPLRHKIQGLESDILVNRYNLVETLKKHCKSKEDFKRAEKELLDVDQNLDKHRKEMLAIEEKYNKGDQEGDLKRLPFWVFIALMTIVGIAETIIYFYVFQSQEMMGKQDVNTWFDNILYYGFPLVMAVGFTVMMIWLAHKLGMMLRQYMTVHKKMLRAYWIKFFIILAVVVGATVATVVIRGKMHEIMYIQNKIVHMQESMTDIGTMMGDMDDMSMSMDTDDMTMSIDTADMDMSMGDDMSIDTNKKEISSEKITEKVKLEKEKYEANKSLPETQDELEHLVSTLKGQLAQLFIVINLFVITAGIFLAYEVHTSSIAYEALESMIGRLKHRRKKLLKIKHDAENALSKNEKDELLQVLKKYVETVNTFDENSQLVKSLRVSIENIYIEMVYYMLGAMEEQNLLTEFDLEYMEQFSPEYLSERFKQEWKLENIDIISEEVMHINNIDKFIEEFQCDKLKKKDIKDV